MDSIECKSWETDWSNFVSGKQLKIPHLICTSCMFMSLLLLFYTTDHCWTTWRQPTGHRTEEPSLQPIGVRHAAPNTYRPLPLNILAVSSVNKNSSIRRMGSLSLRCLHSQVNYTFAAIHQLRGVGLSQSWLWWFLRWDMERTEVSGSGRLWGWLLGGRMEFEEASRIHKRFFVGF